MTETKKSKVLRTVHYRVYGSKPFIPETPAGPGPLVLSVDVTTGSSLRSLFVRVHPNGRVEIRSGAGPNRRLVFAGTLHELYNQAPRYAALKNLKRLKGWVPTAEPDDDARI